jgi:WD40 repeat protein
MTILIGWGWTSTKSANEKAAQVAIAQTAQSDALIAKATAIEEASVRATAQANAQQQSEIAIAQKLTYQSQAESVSNQVLGLLLAVQANRLYSDIPTRSAMLYALQTHPRVGRYFQYKARDYAIQPIIVFSPNDKYVAMQLDDWRINTQTISVWDRTTGRILYSEDFTYDPNQFANTALSQLYFHDDVTLIFSHGTQLFTVDIPNHEKQQRNSQIKVLGVSGKGQILIGEYMNKFWVLDWNSLQPMIEIDLWVNAASKYALSSDGTHLVVITGYPQPGVVQTIYRIETRSGQIVNEFNLEKDRIVGHLSINSNGTRMVYQLLNPRSLEPESYYFEFYSNRTYDFESSTELWAQSKFQDLSFFDDETLFAIDWSEKAILFYSAPTGEPLEQRKIDLSDSVSASWNGDFQLSQDRYFAAYSLDNSFAIFDIQHQELLSTTLNVLSNQISDLQFLQGDSLMATSLDGDVALIHTTTTDNELIHIPSLDELSYSNALGHTGRYVVNVNADENQITILSTEGNEVLGNYKIDPAHSLIDFDLSKDGKIAIATTYSIDEVKQDYQGDTYGSYAGYKIEILTLPDLKPVTNFETPHDAELYPYGDWVRKIAFSPDGTRVAVAIYASISIYDLDESRFVVHTPILHGNDIDTLIYSPDGKRIVSSASDRSIIVWDAESGEQIGKTIFGEDRMIATAISPDGSLLASGGWGEGRVSLWDLSTGQLIGLPLQGTGNPIYKLAFSDDSNILVAGDDAGNIMFWDISSNGLRERSCDVANRNITYTEWQQYIGDALPYQAVCPNLPMEPESTLAP